MLGIATRGVWVRKYHKFPALTAEKGNSAHVGHEGQGPKICYTVLRNNWDCSCHGRRTIQR